MKDQHVLADMILLFWFGWFAMAGIAISALIHWISMAEFNFENVLLTGSLIGIITGGIAAVTLYIINWRKYGNTFGEDRSFLRRQQKEKPRAL